MHQEKQFLLDLRKHFRLNIYEVKIWTALLSRGIASAGELSDISGVPRSRCYDILESLEKKGFIIMNIGKPIKYLAVKPEVILERVKENIENEASSIATQIESIKETDEFKELELLHKTGIQHVDIATISKSIVGRTNINSFIKEMVLRAKSKVFFVTNKEHTEKAAKILKNFAKKEVKVKLYAPYSGSANLRKLQNVEYFEYNSSSRFVILDGKELIFLLSNEGVSPEYEVAVWINSPFFVNAISILFEASLKK